MNKNICTLKDIIRTSRIEKGLSLREFGEIVNLSHTYLNKLEKGFDPRTGKEIVPTIDTLIKISEGLDIPTEKFLSICGYLENEDKDELETEVSLELLLSEFIESINNYKYITLNGHKLTEKDLNNITEKFKHEIQNYNFK